MREKINKNNFQNINSEKTIFNISLVFLCLFLEIESRLESKKILDVSSKISINHN